MLIIEELTVTVKWRTAMTAVFIYFNLCLGVMLDSRMFIYIHNLSYQFIQVL